MLSPILIGVWFILAYYLAPKIIKHRKVLYTAVWGLLILIVIFRKLPILLPFIKGFVGFSLLYVVMITGALNPSWKLTQKLRSVRAPYSILGFILLMAHPLYYAPEVLAMTRDIPWFGLASFVVMIPLFITSYLVIRMKMKPKSWKNLQRFAYLSYALTLIHLIVNASTVQNRMIAIVLFIPYVVLKLIKICRSKAL